jgi:polyribonucleotide 5'-hydroxyl-kinase
VDILAVVGNERLHSELLKKLQPTYTNLNILKLPKSGGVVLKDAAFRRLQMMKCIKSYFYGPQMEYSAFPVIIPFNDLHIRRIGEGPVAPTSALPLGATRKLDESRVVRVELIQSSTNAPNTVYLQPKSLLNSVLAISQTEIGEEQLIPEKPVAGYILVTAVDEVKNRLTFLSPVPGRFPFPYLILGSIKYLE